MLYSTLYMLYSMEALYMLYSMEAELHKSAGCCTPCICCILVYVVQYGGLVYVVQYLVYVVQYGGLVYVVQYGGRVAQVCWLLYALYMLYPCICCPVWRPCICCTVPCICCTVWRPCICCTVWRQSCTSLLAAVRLVYVVSLYMLSSMEALYMLYSTLYMLYSMEALYMLYSMEAELHKSAGCCTPCICCILVYVVQYGGLVYVVQYIVYVVQYGGLVYVVQYGGRVAQVCWLLYALYMLYSMEALYMLYSMEAELHKSAGCCTPCICCSLVYVVQYGGLVYVIRYG